MREGASGRFTMLHQIPSLDLPDRACAETGRMLCGGGTFAGTEPRQRVVFELIHIGDTLTPIDPATLPSQLQDARLVGPR